MIFNIIALACKGLYAFGVFIFHICARNLNEEFDFVMRFAVVAADSNLSVFLCQLEARADQVVKDFFKQQHISLQNRQLFFIQHVNRALTVFWVH